MPVKRTAIPWVASLRSLIWHIPCFLVGSRALERSSSLWYGWRHCSLVPSPKKPGPLWLICLRMWRNNKKLKLNKATLKVNWISPSTGFHFLFKSFWCDRISENWAWIPALLFYSRMNLSKLLVSHLCFQVLSTFFLVSPFLYFSCFHTT